MVCGCVLLQEQESDEDIEWVDDGGENDGIDGHGTVDVVLNVVWFKLFNVDGVVLDVADWINYFDNKFNHYKNGGNAHWYTDAAFRAAVEFIS